MFKINNSGAFLLVVALLLRCDTNWYATTTPIGNATTTQAKPGAVTARLPAPQGGRAEHYSNCSAGVPNNWDSAQFLFATEAILAPF